jgi:hypothetical protein
MCKMVSTAGQTRKALILKNKRIKKTKTKQRKKYKKCSIWPNVVICQN